MGLGILAATAIGCSSADTDVVLKFATPEARNQTRSIAFTAFEPVLAQPDSEDQVPRFIECGEVSVFPPTRVVGPDTISTVPNLAGVVSERTTQSFPLSDDWLVDLRSNNFNTELNPWGAVMVYVEARGDALAPESRGGGQISATLLAGCFCIRTRDGSFPDRDLDNQVKRACAPIEGELAVQEREVLLEPVVRREFRLEICEGTESLAAPKSETLSPGPSVCVETTQCSAISVPAPCFNCEQPCSELNDKSNVPVQFEVFRGNARSDDETEVVLTSASGSAQFQLDVGDCAEQIRVEARIVGRPDERASFTVDCVDTVEGFDCPLEIALPQRDQPRSMSRVPGDAQRCLDGETSACDHLAVLSDRADDAELSIYNVVNGQRVTSINFPDEKAHAVVGYYYSLTARQDPAVVVATSSMNKLRLRVYEWDVATGTLTPHDGADGILESPCDRWLCGSLATCGTGVCSTEREACFDGICQTVGETNAQCMESEPVFCNCEQEVDFQAPVTVRVRDLDGDDKADLAVGNSSQFNIHFIYSGEADEGTFYTDRCTCGLFGVPPQTFDLATFGGETPLRNEVDLALGSNGGFFIKYADRETPGIPVSVHCGRSTAIGDNASVRDIQAAPLQCRLNDTCVQNYDDVVAISARATTGGGLNDPGTVLVLSGSADELMSATRIPAQVRRELPPRRLGNRVAQPEDPQRIRLADFNGDAHRDIAVLYKGSQEIHVWLGASNGGFGEISQGILLNDCASSASAGDCPPLTDLVAVDSDGDGREELMVICSPTQGPRLRRYSPN
ncbi:MAG: FG-GAP-like repeat-containing protein [Myxococcota bacterium]